MDTPRECGCKGCRTCLLCETKYGVSKDRMTIDKKSNGYIYCPKCKKAYPGWQVDDSPHPDHQGTPINYPGVEIIENFITEQEEEQLMEAIDGTPWELSQSGRRKQNYGPKCNFKKRKLRLGEFNGFPKATKFLQDRFKDIEILKSFQTIEQCALEYDPIRGASIDPHVDDCWIWGERIVTVNMLSDSILSMTCNLKKDRYNLDCVESYPAVMTPSGLLNSSSESYKFGIEESDVVVRIPMPRFSLLVLYNAPRYEWEHEIFREDITERRVCLAYREFTPDYLENGCKFDEGKIILEKSECFI